MNKLLALNFLFIALIINAISCKNADTGASSEHIEKYENGQISRRYEVINGKREGEMKDYYKDGRMMAVRYFKNDKQDGRTVIFHPNGVVKEVQYFTQGKKEQGDTIWYENGNIQFVATMKNDKKNGYMRKWDTVGQLIYEAKYDMDTLVEVKGQPIGKDNAAAVPSQIIKRKD